MVQTPTDTNYQTGQYVFTRDGVKHLVREVLPDRRLLVSRMLLVEQYDGEDEEYPSPTGYLVGAADVSQTAPVAVLDAEIASRNAQLADLTARINAARSEVWTAERDTKQQIEKLAKFPRLARLFDYLDGKITHFVVSEYQHAAHIKTWDEFAIYREGGRDKGVKLLTLFGDSKGNTEWRLNHYNDGSGINTVCQPCTSEEEAKEVVGQWLEAAWEEFKPSNPWFLNGAINSADVYGFPVPQHIRDAVVAHQNEAHQRTIAKLEADLEAARARYAAQVRS